jgi:hypothetical protein
MAQEVEQGVEGDAGEEGKASPGGGEIGRGERHRA